jgi:hypothetical protein
MGFLIAAVIMLSVDMVAVVKQYRHEHDCKPQETTQCSHRSQQQ